MSRIIKLELNRVEGDLELQLEIEGHQVIDAWSVGTMYRGFEQILKGRAATDGIVITPRICGICGTAHQYAAVAALETAFNCPIAPNGTRVRNACLMTEEIQSDARHTFFMYTIDFCNPIYRDQPWYDEALAYFEPFKGWVYREVVQQTKKILEIVAIFGGQWPHSSYMLPGGVVTAPSQRKLIEALTIVDAYQQWYERSILGCSVDRWLAIRSAADLDAWLDESERHHKSPIGLFIRIARALGLEKLGRGAGNMLSFGAYFDPDRWQPPFAERACLLPAGFHDAETGEIAPFEPSEVLEHVKHSWFLDYEGGRHPGQGETIPDYQKRGPKYSWSKAPRYRGHVVEVGPLAEQFVAGDALTRDLFRQSGSCAWLRQFIRLHRPVGSLQRLRQQLMELAGNLSEPFYLAPASTEEGTGAGLLHAARGGLGHWVQIKEGKIDRYQIIAPTTWNASPRDSDGIRGHWEETLVGTEVRDLDNPVELGHIIRSHDPCLVCTVHVLKTGARFTYGC